jgi:hypothetical protein
MVQETKQSRTLKNKLMESYIYICWDIMPCTPMKVNRRSFSPETSVDFHRTTPHYILEDGTFHIHLSKNLRAMGSAGGGRNSYTSSMTVSFPSNVADR